MPKTFTLPLVLGVLVLQGCAHHTVALWSENESWITGPVGITNYSNGLHLTFSPTTPHDPCAARCDGQIFRRIVDFVNVLEAKNGSPEDDIWLRYGLAQQFFTPDDITIPTLQPDDRPYAGWLYTSLDIVNEKIVPGNSGNSLRHRNTVGLRIGIVGPSSLGEDLQKRWHELRDLTTPQGWHLQLRDEPGFSYSLGHERQIIRNDISSGWSYDVIGSAQAAIGNIYTAAELGGMFRLGWNLNSRWAAKTMADVAYDDAVIYRHPGFFVFAALAGRYVARDIFVDGNTWRDSHSVSRTPLVSDQMIGFGIDWRRLGIRATYTRRTDQYRTQAAATRFGSLVLIWRP